MWTHSAAEEVNGEEGRERSWKRRTSAS